MADYDIAHQTITIPTIGANLNIGGKWYAVMATRTFQDSSTAITTFTTLLEIDDEGEDVGNPTIEYNLDLYDYTY